MIRTVVFVCLVFSVKAFDLDQQEEYDREERIFTSGGTLNLNATSLQTLGALLAATLLGILTLLAFAPKGSSSSSSGYGQSYGSSGHRAGGPEYDFYEDEFSYRRRSGSGLVDGFTDQLNLLAEAFHKYEIDETNGCQLYVACESSDIAKHRKNGALAKTVYHAMRKISEPQNARLYEDDKYLMDIMSAFKIGSSGQSCQQFRKQCRKEKVFSG